MEISKTETTLNCEALILGSGAGGSVIAETLTKSGLDVLMIEEGPHIVQGKLPTTATESFGHQWRSGGLNVALGDPMISYAEGRCVGGGTEINSAIMQKPPESLIKQWAIKYQIDQFGVNEINAYINKALDRVNAILYTTTTWYAFRNFKIWRRKTGLESKRTSKSTKRIYRHQSFCFWFI